MRFDESYDAATISAGYRDVQLSVQIKTAWTQSKGLEQIVCEVQLHDSRFYEHKTKGGGHELYVSRRNALAI